MQLYKTPWVSAGDKISLSLSLVGCWLHKSFLATLCDIGLFILSLCDHAAHDNINLKQSSAWNMANRSVFHAFHKESKQRCSNVAAGCNICPIPGTAVWMRSLWLMFLLRYWLWTPYDVPKLVSSILTFSSCSSCVSLGSTTSSGSFDVTFDVTWLALRLAEESIEHKAPWWLSQLVRKKRIWCMEIRFQFHGLLPCVKPVYFYQIPSHCP